MLKNNRGSRIIPFTDPSCLPASKCYFALVLPTKYFHYSGEKKINKKLLGEMAFLPPERDKGTMISLHSSFGLSVDKGVSNKRQTGFCSKEKRTRNEIKRT